MIKIILLTSLFSCATSKSVDSRKEITEEKAVCRNTLQRDIHRAECIR